MQLMTAAAASRVITAPRVCFIVESGTDVRLVEGLASRFQITIFARRIQGGVEISQEPSASVNMLRGPSSRVQFAIAVLRFLWSGRVKELVPGRSAALPPTWLDAVDFDGSQIEIGVAG